MSGMICLIDDQEFYQHIARRLTSTNTGLLVVENPRLLESLDESLFGLVIIDRMMELGWSGPRDRFLKRFVENVPGAEVVEWSIASKLHPEERHPLARWAIDKHNGQEVADLIKWWKINGTVEGYPDAV